MTQAQVTILIVDDNHANRRILSATFEDSHFHVYTAASVEEAQIKLKSHLDEIDLVLSDIQMPGLSGFDLVKWMKAEKSAIRDIPILLITSQLPDTENRIHGLSLGAVDYLLKSLDHQELVIRATHAIESFNQLKNLRASLESTENLAFTGQLFAASNHEIKNISQIIRIASSILQRELKPEKVATSNSCQQALKMLSQAANLLADSTKMISDIVGNTNPLIGEVDLTNLVEHTVVMTRPLLKSQIELSSSAGNAILVMGNPTFIKQILINLIFNARDAIEEARPHACGKIAVEVLSVHDAHIELRVTDNGVGLPQRETRVLFEPFASTKQLRGGTGLGLWLSAHLAQKMGGAIELSSEGAGLGAMAKLILKRVKP